MSDSQYSKRNHDPLRQVPLETHDERCAREASTPGYGLDLDSMARVAEWKTRTGQPLDDGGALLRVIEGQKRKKMKIEDLISELARLVKFCSVIIGITAISCVLIYAYCERYQVIHGEGYVWIIDKWTHEAFRPVPAVK